MTGQHVRSESAAAAAAVRRTAAPSASLSSSWSNPGPARTNNLRSALRGLSISEPSSQTVSSQVPLSQTSSTAWPGLSRTEWPTPQNPSPETESRRNDAGTSSSSASEEASARAMVDRRLGQLKGYTQRLRAARVPGSDPGSVDSAYDEFARVMHEASDAVEAVVLATYNSSRPADRSRRARNGSVAETVERLESMSIAQGGTAVDGDMDILKASFSTLGLGGPMAPTGLSYEDRARHNRDSGASNGPVYNDSSLAVIRDWRAVLVKLLQSHRSSLVATTQAYKRDAPAELTERALGDPDYRAGMIQEMRTRKAPLASSSTVVSPAHWSLYERRFRHYDTVKETIMHVDRLLTMAAPGAEKMDKVNNVRDYIISPRGNAVLEFENTGALDTPLLRFRVSSHMLAETSPIFEAVFGGQFSHPRILDRDLRELDGQVPREPPRSVTCADGSCVRLYSMPQLEPNKEEALTILLYAAHMQNDKVPREVSFAQFTAIAEVCMRYRCTSPVELMVEHRWLPAWMHKATEQQPDGILLISYAFGLRRLFTRMSKTAVLNIVDEEELRAKPWPKAIKDKVWAVRNAKLAQVHSTCVGAVQEYFRPPARPSSDTGHTTPLSHGDDPTRGSFMSEASSYLPQPPLPSYVSLMSLTSAPRCPRGDHWCDATSLGWLLLVMNELQLAWTVVNPSVLPCAQGQQSQPPRSLAQLLDVLRSIPSPRHPPHSGSTVCDPAPALRAAANDVYNSISGLTLFDVDGKRHGWGLSKHRLNEPQTIRNVSLGKLSRLSLGGSNIHHDVVAPAQAPTQDTRALTHVYTEDLMPGNGSDQDTAVGQDQQVQQGRIPKDMQRPRSPIVFAPDEALFLRIMRNTETFDDLHALALVSPASYAAFKNNELALMRPLVGAWRRRTLSALAGGPAQSQNLLPRELARLDDLQARSEEKMARKQPPDPSPAPPLSRHQSTEDDALAEAVQLESSWSSDTEEGYEAGASDGREGEDDREMTEDEARLILWPEQPAASCYRVTSGYLANGQMTAPPGRGAVDREDSDDKFLTQDLSRLPEEKSLAVLGDKTLGVDLDRRKCITSA